MNRIHRLSHDHEPLRRMVLSLGAVLDRIGRGELAADEVKDELVARCMNLADELAGHFAREERALFPVLRALAPAIVGTIDGLVEGHRAADRDVAELLAAVQALPSGAADLSAARTAYDRLADDYGRHPRHELEMLRELEARLEAEDLQRVDALLREI